MGTLGISSTNMGKHPLSFPIKVPLGKNKYDINIDYFILKEI